MRECLGTGPRNLEHGVRDMAGDLSGGRCACLFRARRVGPAVTRG